MRPILPVIAAALLGSATPAALAQPFTLLIFEAPDQLALRGDTTSAGQAYWKAYGDFAVAAKEAGILRGGSALHSEPQVMTMKDGQARELASPPLQLTGYFQIDVSDRTAAIDWAARLPAATSGTVEIRQGYPAPGM
jgi:hypothetical protein